MKVFVLMEDDAYEDLGTLSRPIGIYSTEAAAEEAGKKLSSVRGSRQYWVTESTFNQGE